MNKKFSAVIFIGIIMALLGLLWSLQGAGIIHLRPILCFANCEPITGKSPLWQAIGVIAFFSGIVIIVANVRRIYRKRKT